MNTAADNAYRAKHELVFALVSEILRAPVDGSDMVSFDGCLGLAEAESVVVGRRPDNVHDVNCLDVVLVRRMCGLCVVCVAQPASTSQHSSTLCLRHTGIVCIE